MRTCNRSVRLGLASASAIALAAVPSGAQTAQADSRADAESPPADQLGDIIVTAQKRAESVQDVPASITAIGSEALETRQIRDITDLQTQVPSLVIGQGYGANLVTLRGISTGITSGAEDPSVAVHVNGVYQPRSRSLDAVLLDLDRVEVLAGPQGTLYGRNATGGVINYVTKGPSREFEGYVTGTVANYHRYAVRAGVSGPLSDGVSFRLSGIYDNQDKGFTRNLTPDAPKRSVEDNRVAGGHATLRLQPTAAVTVDLDGFYLDTRSSTIQTPFELSPAPFAAALAPQEIRPHLTRSLVPSRLDTKYGQASANARWDITDDVSLKYIFSYQHYDNRLYIDYDGSAFDAVSTRQNFRSRTFQNEVDLSTSLFGDRLRSIYGFYHFDDHFTTTSYTVLGFGLGLPFPIPANLTFPFDQRARSFAGFTDQTLSVTDRLRLVAGVRYNSDRKEVTRSGQIDEFGPGSICAPASFKRKFNSWTPKFGAQFDAADDVMLYAQWQRGFKSGGFPANSCSPAYDPERIKGPEVGVKSEFLNHHLRLNVAAYYYDYSNLQVQKVDAQSNFSVQNAAAARLKGVEFSALALLTEKLRVNLSGNIQSAKYTDFSNCNSAAFVGACTGFDPRPVAARLDDLSGNPLNRAPSYTINLGAEYNVSLGDRGSLLLRGESYFSGKVHFDEFQNPALTQEAYSLQNAFVTFTPTNDRFQVRAYVKNLGDKDYKVSGFYLAQIGSGGGNWGAPRTYGGELTFRF